MKALLNISTIKTQIQVGDASLLYGLRDALTVRKGSYVGELDRRASAWSWSGKVAFVAVSRAAKNPLPTAHFPTLLLPQVRTFWGTAYGHVPLEVQSDSRPVAPAWMDASLLLLGERLTTPLRPYQSQALEQILQAKQGIVRIPTGGGKTVVYAALMKLIQLRDPDVCAIVLFRSVSLVKQASSVLESMGIVHVYCVHGGAPPLESGARVILSTVQSAHHIPAEFLGAARLLVADECHLFTGTTSTKVLRACSSTWIRLGFSATPWKEKDEAHNMQLLSWLGPEICSISTADLTQRQVLCRAVCRFYHLPRRGMQLWDADYFDAYSKGCVENDDLNHLIVSLVQKLEGRILILVTHLAHGDRLASLLRSISSSGEGGGSECLWISGNDPIDQREVTLQKLRSSNKKRCVAILSSIGSTGIDVHIHHLINAAGGTSPHLTIQSIGRGLRTAHDKDGLTYYDFINHSNYYLESHSKSRMETLSREGHEITVM